MNVILGTPGSTELPFLLDMPSDFRYVPGRHERTAIGMGLGYAPATRRAAFVNVALGGQECMGVDQSVNLPKYG